MTDGHGAIWKSATCFCTGAILEFLAGTSLAVSRSGVLMHSWVICGCCDGKMFMRTSQILEFCVIVSFLFFLYYKLKSSPDVEPLNNDILLKSTVTVKTGMSANPTGSSVSLTILWLLGGNSGRGLISPPCCELRVQGVSLPPAGI